MMKKSMLAVALVMVGGVAVAGDTHAACTAKGLVSRAACGAKYYGYTLPKENVQVAADYAWNGNHSGTTLTTWSDRAVRLTGLAAILYHGLVPATSKAYAFLSAQVKALRTARK